MTIRLDGCLMKGELDNRTRGQVRGRLWLHGWTETLEIDIQGDAMRDLAGLQISLSASLPPQAAPVRSKFHAGDMPDESRPRQIEQANLLSQIPNEENTEVLKLIEEVRRLA